jgi:murein DD-endopeptidase MepM/ murein hydrolase activator NlpD
MEIIIVKNSKEQSRKIHLGGGYFIAMMIVLGGLIWAGFRLGGYFVSERTDLAVSEPSMGQAQEIETLKAQLEQLQLQRSELEMAREAAEDHVEHLVQRVGKLQAHVVRLEALGSRLAEIAHIEESEFELAAVPPQGGPLEGEHLYPPFVLTAESVQEFGQAVDDMLEKLDNKTDQLSFLESYLIRNQVDQQSVVAGKPVQSGWVSSRFGRRTDPFTGKPAYHSGVDIAGKPGTEIVAVADGIVTWSGDRWAYGLVVELDHGRGYTTRYAHANELLVQVGERVKKGQVIARMGSTGRSTGTHLHFEVRKNGKATNPQTYMQRRS